MPTFKAFEVQSKFIIDLFVIVEQMVHKSIPYVVQVSERQEQICLIWLLLVKTDQRLKVSLLTFFLLAVRVEQQHTLVPVELLFDQLEVVEVYKREILAVLVDLRDAGNDALVVENLNQLVGQQPVRKWHQSELVRCLSQRLENFFVVLKLIVDHHMNHDVKQRQNFNNASFFHFENQIVFKNLYFLAKMV